jgi:hypothetical protein
MVNAQTDWRAHVAALCWRVAVFAPAALSIWYLNRTGTYRTLVFDGGWTTRFYVLSWAVITPYLGWLVTATGRLTFSLIRLKPALPIDAFFVGAATLILIGFALGAFSILFPTLVLGLMLAVLLMETPGPKALSGIFTSFWGIANSPLLLLMCCSGLLLFASVFLSRAAMPDVVSSDVQQLYAPYLAEVARNHSIWMAPDNPIFSDFEIGHGNGFHLLLATFLPPEVGQIISFLYYLAIGAVTFELARAILPFQAFPPRWQQAALPTALGVALLGLAAPMIVAPASTGTNLYFMEFGKYHLQTAAFLLYFLLISIRTFGNRDLLATGVCGLAISISYPLYAAYALLISALGAAAKIVQRNRFGFMVCVLLGSATATGAAVTLALNYLYLGIPATNPYSVFRHFVFIDRFSRFGSLDILDYFVLAQSLQLSDFFDSRGLYAFLGQTAATIGIATIVAAMLFIVARSDSKLFPGGRGANAQPLNAAGLAILVAYFGSVRFLDLALNIPSLERLSAHLTALLPLTIVAIALWALAILSRWTPTSFSGRTAPHLLGWGLLIICAWTIHLYPVQSAKDSSSIEFARGRALAKLPHNAWNWARCDELQQVNGRDRILPLNGYRAMVPCYFSPLLTRGKVIHTYESDVARDFRKIALGDADSAELDLRSLGVNLFYVQKRNCDFWLNGFAELFGSDQLKRRFSIYRETPDYWILTWKGDQRLSPNAATSISGLIERSRAIYREAYGIEPFEAIKHHLRSYRATGHLHALDQLVTCG